MPTLKRYVYWECPDVNGNVHSGGSRSEPIETSVDGYLDHNTVSLATDTSLTLWNSDEAITNFDYFYIKSTQQLKLELTVDRGGTNGLEELVILLPANKPFELPTDDALANYSGTLSGGTTDVIDEIVVRNESGSTASIDYAVIT